MSRLLIKSSVCAASQGVFSKEVKDSEGIVTTPRTKLKEPIEFKDGAKVTYKVNAKTITVTVAGIAHSIPIPAEAEKHRE